MKVIRKNPNLFWPILFILVSVFALFMPIYLNKFGYHNDYRIWEYPHEGIANLFLGYPESQHLLGIGRPLGAVLLNLQLFPIHSMQALAVNQYANVAFIACFAVWCFYFFTRYIQISAFFAALLVILIVSLPAMTINSFWVANLVPSLIPLFLALWAQTLLEREKPRLAYVIGILFCGFLIYPPATFFFATLSFSKFLFGPKRSEKLTLSKLFTEIKIILGSSLAFFILLKIYKIFLIKTNFLGFDWRGYYYGIKLIFPQYHLTLGIDPHAKLLQLTQFFSLLISSWFPPLSSFLLLLVATGLLGILGWILKYNSYLKQTAYLENNPRVGLGLIFGIGIGLLSALPIIVGPAIYEITYRAIFPSSALIPIILVCFMSRWFEVFQRSAPLTWIGLILFILFFISVTYLSMKRLSLVVERSAQEYSKIESALAKQMRPETTEIRIQRPIIPEADPSWLNGDFSLDATSYQMEGIIRATLLELGYDPANYRFAFGNYFAKSSRAIMVPRLAHIPIYHRMVSNELLGQWFRLGRKVSIQLKDNHLVLTNEYRMSSEARIKKNAYLYAKDWNTLATLSQNGQELHWDNGTKWLR